MHSPTSSPERPNSSPDNSARRLWGVITRKERWGLSWRGRLLVFGVILMIFLLGIKCTVPFLSPNQPIPAEVLIVEGWLPDYVLKDARDEFDRGKYRYVITEGSPLLSGYYTSGAKTSADLAAATLVTLGLESNVVVSVPAAPVLRGRSLASAKAINDWIHIHEPTLKAVNVYTLGVHGRRTKMIFERVIGKTVKVGVISHPDAAYDIDQWWLTSEGFRTVTGEAMAYLWECLHG